MHGKAGEHMATRQTAERRQEIRRLILDGALPPMGELAGRFGVSRETIRKDLLALEKDGLGRKGYGGTFIVEAVQERKLALRLAENVDKKAAIARAALGHIPGGSTVLLDAGSTTLELARLLKGVPDLHIVTNSATIPQLLVDCPSTVSCLGGDLRKTSLAFTGPWTLAGIRSLRADVAFLGADALDADGPCTSVVAEAEVKRAMAATACQCVVLCDSTKLSKRSGVPICPWGDVDLLITDGEIPDEDAKRLEQWVRVEAAKGF